jgi:hypothetical protein
LIDYTGPDNHPDHLDRRRYTAWGRSGFVTQVDQSTVEDVYLCTVIRAKVFLFSDVGIFMLKEIPGQLEVRWLTARFIAFARVYGASARCLRVGDAAPLAYEVRSSAAIPTTDGRIASPRLLYFFAVLPAGALYLSRDVGWSGCKPKRRNASAQT